MQKGHDEVFSTIRWTRTDIEKLLKENGYDYSKQAVDQFLTDFNVRYFEERCIQLGWELLQSII